MSALTQEKKLTREKYVADDITLIYDLADKPNRTNLKAKDERAVVAKLRADLVLPEDKIMTVDIDFDSTSGYHNNTMMVMDDFGVEMLATAFEVKYGKESADKIRTAWQTREHPDAPRYPTYLLVQKPQDGELPKIYAKCGDGKEHPPSIAPESII